MKKAFITASLIALASSAQAQSPINDLSHLSNKKLDVEVVVLPVRSDESGAARVSNVVSASNFSVVKPSDNNNSATETKAVFYLDHNYTNTLRCEINLSVPVVSNDGSQRVIRVSLGEQLIFPKAAFPERRFSYDIDFGGSLQPEERLMLNYKRVQKGAAICSGLKPTDRLPKGVCLDLNENHEKFCRQNASGSGDSYGLNVNNQFIGICSCD